MIVVQFAEELRKQLRAQMNDLADYLAGGGAESFEKYKSITGEIRGLAYAERMLLDAAERLERSASD
jgi:hypothetical protein